MPLGADKQGPCASGSSPGVAGGPEGNDGNAEVRRGHVRRVRASLVLLLIPLFALSLAPLAPSAGAQHEHMGTATAILAHDPPTNGRTYVGDVTSFAVIDDADHDLRPDVHQNNHIRVSENGAVLWEASAAAGHDYDGVNTFLIVFPVTGTYEVALVADDGMVQQHFDGVVEAPHDRVAATVDLQVPASASALRPVPLKLQVEANGVLVNHSDLLVEVRQGLDLVFRTHAHTHTAPVELSYTFPLPGTYTVRATGYLAYATGSTPEFAPVTVEKTILVGAPDPASVAAAPAPSRLPDAMGQNIVTDGTTQGGSYQFFGTYDPYTVVGPGAQMRLAGLVMDPATGQTVQHVNFVAKLEGPLGTVFESSSLHEYDGVYELAAKEQVPGAYTLTLDAAKGGWSGHLVLPYSVVAAPATSGFGPVAISSHAAGVVAGAATTLTLAAKDAAGMPYQHSEVDVVVLDAAGNGLLWTKLHTHEDGVFPLTFAFPAAGAYTVRVAPSALDGAPLTYLGGPLSAAVDIPVSVAAGPGIPAVVPPVAAPTTDASHASPAGGLLLVAAALGVALVLRRRA